jgi:hypothetical protein
MKISLNASNTLDCHLLLCHGANAVLRGCHSRFHPQQARQRRCHRCRIRDAGKDVHWAECSGDEHERVEEGPGEEGAGREGEEGEWDGGQAGAHSGVIGTRHGSALRVLSDMFTHVTHRLPTHGVQGTKAWDASRPHVPKDITRSFYANPHVTSIAFSGSSVAHTDPLRFVNDHSADELDASPGKREKRKRRKRIGNLIRKAEGLSLSLTSAARQDDTLSWTCFRVRGTVRTQIFKTAQC